MVYTLSLRVNLADIAYRASDGLGMHLSADQSANRPTGPSFLPITLTPSLANPGSVLLTASAGLACLILARRRQQLPSR